MDRTHAFVPGELYHVYNRGADKRKVFYADGDWQHCQRLLYTRNSTKRIDSERVKRLPLHMVDRGEAIVDIVAYCLMPNHIHLLIHERTEGGISSFMGKWGTAFSKYMNTKYERSGPLMCRPFRSRHVHDDAYLRWLFAYIHLNPIELQQSDFKERGIKNARQAKKYLENYRYSSYCDYFVGERDESRILANDEDIQAIISENNSIRELESLLTTTSV